MRLGILGPSVTSQGKYKWETIGFSVVNEDAYAIQPGTPVYLASNGTDDGIAVYNPVTAPTTGTDSACIGIMAQPLAVNASGKAVVLGMVTNALVVLATRSATSAVVPSFSAVAIFDFLNVATAVNALSRSGAGSVLGYSPMFVAMQSLASATTQASSVTTSAGWYLSTLTTGSLTSATLACVLAGQPGSFKVFVRAI